MRATPDSLLHFSYLLYRKEVRTFKLAAYLVQLSLFFSTALGRLIFIKENNFDNSGGSLPKILID